MDYKDSGVEWLGQVPVGWEVLPIKRCFKRVKRTGFSTERLLSVYREYGVIEKNSRDDNHNKESDDLTPYQLVNVGDLVINKMKAWQGSLAISKLRGIVSPAYYIYKPNDDFKFDHRFLHHQIRSPYFIQSYKNYSKGIRVGQWDLESDEFENINIYLPPLPTQIAIADYLDQECQKIDTLVEAIKTLIAQMREYKKAIIAHTVTKGLDDTIPTKDSGVAWLGQVPVGWEVIRFGRIFKGNKRKNIGLKETNVLSLSYGNIKEKNIDENKGLLPESFETYQIIEPDDIIFRFTDLQNDKKSLRSAISKYHGIITSAYISVKTEQNANFYNYLFRAYDLQKVFYAMGDGMRQSLKMDELNKMLILLPPLPTQIAIANYLDKECTKMDNLIHTQSTLIAKLNEYKKSLISSAVTGKLEIV